MDNLKIQDPSINGIKGLLGIKGIDELKDSQAILSDYLADEFALLSRALGPIKGMRERNILSLPYQLNIGNEEVGQSRYDNDITAQFQLLDINNTRGELQPWYDLIGAGLAKGVILAGTTFLSGTIGLATGIGTAISEKRWSGLWDNETDKALLSVNELSEKALPNYYTNAELQNNANGQWWKNIPTANFLGDKFIKNLGFTVGAYFSGEVFAGALAASGLAETVGILSKGTLFAERVGGAARVPLLFISNTGAVMSAFNEGRIEALNNSTLWGKLLEDKANDAFTQELYAIQTKYQPLIGKSLSGTIEGGMYDPAYKAMQDEMRLAEIRHNEVLSKINEDKLKMGNMDLLLNMPLLTASNIILFGKLYGGGYKTARKALRAIEGSIEEGFKATGSTARNIGRALLNPLSEGNEEFMLNVASSQAGNYYATDIDNFYRAKKDPNAELLTLSFTKAFADAMNENVNSGDSWELFFIGALTGAMGMPSFRSMKNSETGKFQSPVTIRGGFIGELKELNELTKRADDITKLLNNRIQSPEFINYYLGMNRHNAYLNAMNLATVDGNEFDFKNAEHALLISDINMFDNAGKLEDLKLLVKMTMGDKSDANLNELIKQTTAVSEDKKLTGPFAQYATLDNEGNIKVTLDDEGKLKVIELLDKNTKDFIDNIDNYKKIKEDIDVRSHENLSDQQLEELVWLKSLIGNWQLRSNDIHEAIKPLFSQIIGSLTNKLLLSKVIANIEGSSNKDVTENYEHFSKLAKVIEHNIGILSSLIHSPGIKVAKYLADSPEVKKLILKVAEDSGLNADDLQDFNLKLDDLVKLHNATELYSSKYKEYYENPDGIILKNAKVDKKLAKDELNKKTSTLKEKLKGALNLQEYRDILDAEENSEIKSQVSLELEDEEDAMTKNHKDVEIYNRAMRKAINDANLDEQTAEKVNLLYKHHSDMANSLQDIANTLSIHLNTPEMLEDLMTEEEHKNALEHLIPIMLKVNKDNKFKLSFNKNPNAEGTSTTPSEVKEELIDSEIESKLSDKESSAKQKDLNNRSKVLIRREQRRRNYFIIKNKIKAVQNNRSQLLNSLNSIDDLITFIESLLDSTINNSSKNIDDLIKSIKLYLKLLNSNSKKNSKFGNKVDDNILNLKFNLSDQFSLLRDINNRLVELKAQKELLELILQDLKNLIDYYNSLISLNKNLSLEKILLKIDDINKKKNILLLLLNKVKKFIDKLIKLLDEVITKTTLSIQEFNDFKSGFSPLSTELLKEAIHNDSSTLTNYAELNLLFAQLEQKVQLNLDNLDKLENTKLKKLALLQSLNKKIVNYDNLLRYIEELLDAFILEEQLDIEDILEVSNPILEESKPVEAVIISEDIVNSSDEESKSMEDQPTKDIPNEDVDKVNEGITNTTEDVKPTKNNYIPAIPELHINGRKDRNFAPMWVVDLLNKGFTQELIDEIAKRKWEKEPTDKKELKEFYSKYGFSNLYKYLEANGAFDYVDNGNLKPDTEVGFMVDPAFSNTEIFIIDKATNLVLGSLMSGEGLTAQYPGLKVLHNKILTEFNKNKNKTDKFIASPTTKVSLIIPGYVIYTKLDRSLKQVDGINNKENRPLLGVVKNGKISTNGAIEDNEILYPKNIDKFEGGVFLLLPNARKGMSYGYSPVMIKVKHFNGLEFDLQDVNVLGTSIYKNIINTITSLANITNDDLTSTLKIALANELYMQDMYINYVENDNNPYLSIAKVKRDNEGNIIKKKYTNKEGKEEEIQERETIKVYYKKRAPSKMQNQLSAFDAAVNGEKVSLEDIKDEYKDTLAVINEIANALQHFNLRFQVGANSVNSPNYNEKLINSDILQANLETTQVKSSYFTTDYFDNDGNLKQTDVIKFPENKPLNVTPSPLGSAESIDSRINVELNGGLYKVDLSTETIYDYNDNVIEPNAKPLLLDLAQADNIYGNKTNAAGMVDNKVLLPDGKVLDRTKKKYLSPSQAEKVKKEIEGKAPKELPKEVIVNKTLDKVAEDLRKVNKEKTDNKFYYIKEEDGLEYKYSRVHSIIGSNWIESLGLKDYVTSVQAELSKLSLNKIKYNSYLDNLGKYHNIDLSEFRSKGLDTEARLQVVAKVKLAMLDNSAAIVAGKALDNVIRVFFTSNTMPVKPDNMSQEAFNDLIKTLNGIRTTIESTGELFFANNVVVYHKYADGTRIAGELDILAVDKNGNFKIYDVKSSKYTFGNFTAYGKELNYFKNKGPQLTRSTEELYTLLLSAYKNLFESQYGVPVTTLAIMPFVLKYGQDKIITSVTKENGILMPYNPNVKVPLENLQSTKAESLKSSAQTQEELKQSSDSSVLQEHKSSLDILNLDDKPNKRRKPVADKITPLNKVNIEGITLSLSKASTITLFNLLTKEQLELINKYGTTEEKFNSLSLEEKDLTLKCAGV